MSIQDWVDAGVRLFEAGIWPFIVLVGLLIFRDHFPAIGTGLAVLLGKRGFEANTIFGTLKVPGSATGLSTQVETISQLSAETEDPEQKAKLEELELSIVALEGRLQEVKQTNAGYFPRDIAQRAKSILMNDSSPDIPRTFMRVTFYDEELNERSVSLARRADFVLLGLAFIVIPELDDATYGDYVEAAKLLRQEGVSVSDPPFNQEAYDTAHVSDRMSNPQNAGFR